MSKYLIESSTLNSIGNAIRSKTGTSDPFTPAQMATAIGNIQLTNPILVPYVLRPDAELLKRYTFDQWINADLEITIPAYNTTATTLYAAKVLDTYTYDSNYAYFTNVRTLAYPTYKVTTKAKGRQEYSVASYTYEMVDIPANTYQAFLNTTKYSSNNAPQAAASYLRDLYWSSASALGLYTATTYGLWCVPTAPSLSGTTLTINAPDVRIRGSTTYLTSTYYNAITDIRAQYIVEVWRVSRASLNVDGWGVRQQVMKIIEATQSTDHKLY